MGITDNILGLIDPEEKRVQPQAPTSNWVKELIDQRYAPKTERLKRSPLGFEFKQNPFDPSSYYRELGSFRDISRNATAVVQTEVANRQAKEAEAAAKRAYEESQRALGGVNPSFIYNTSTGGVATNGASRRYGLKGVSSTASKAADYFGSKYGIKTIGGRGPGSVPGSDHPDGRALDYMTNNIKNGKAVGDALANDIIKNASAWNVKYVIWYRYIWHPGRGWSKYSGPSDHTDHVHVSFKK